MAFPVLAAVSAVSSLFGLFGDSEKARAEERAAAHNAFVQRQQATMAIQNASESERRIQSAGRKHLGAIKAGVSASGINMEGSALDVLEESATNVQLDALTVKHEGAMKAWALREGAQMDTSRAESARTAGAYGAASSVLRAGSNLASY